jgi:hypothetical protein
MGLRGVVVGRRKRQLEFLGGAPREIDAVSLNHGPGSFV